MILEAAMALYLQSPTRYLPSGYSFRGADISDIPVIVYMLNQRQMKNTAQANSHADELRREWQSARFNPAMDVRMVFDQREMLVGYIEVWMNGSHPWLWGCVHPNFEGRGIGSALLRWGEARVCLELERIPEDLRAAPRFGTLPVQRAHELCEHLGWHSVPMDETVRQEVKKVTGALHLPENANLPYDVYEKDVALLQ
jgi:GNAT superfamily N-acetyltransferase